MSTVHDLKYVGYDSGDALREGVINQQQYDYYNNVDMLTKQDVDYVMNNQEKVFDEFLNNHKK